MFWLTGTALPGSPHPNRFRPPHLRDGGRPDPWLAPLGPELKGRIDLLRRDRNLNGRLLVELGRETGRLLEELARDTRRVDDDVLRVAGLEAGRLAGRTVRVTGRLDRVALRCAGRDPDVVTRVRVGDAVLERVVDDLGVTKP